MSSTTDLRMRISDLDSVPAMDAYTISSNAAQAASPLDEAVIIPPPRSSERINRRTVGSESLCPSIQSGPNPLKGDLRGPTSVKSCHATLETPTTLINDGTRFTMCHARARSDGIPSVHQTQEAPPISKPNDRPAPPHIFTNYGHGENIEDHSAHGLYGSSSSTINSTQHMIRKPLAPAPLTPSPLSIVKQPAPKCRSATREISLVATVCLAHFLTQAGLSQTIAPLPIITSSFTTTTHKPSPAWYSAAYSLTVGTFILPSGRLGDIYGPKRLFLIGWLWFALSSLGAGLYPRIRAVGGEQGSGDGGEIFFCFCRALQGIGPALLMPNGLAILGRTYDDGNKKNMAFAMFGASAPVGFVIGSVMSSLLAQKTNWCWAFWGLAIACTVMAVISIPIVPYLPGTIASAAPKDDSESLENGSTMKTPLWKQLDTPGTLLGITSLILINFAINQAALVQWSTPYTYFLLLLGLVILSIFLFIEFTPSLTPHPLIPRDLLSLDTCFVLACIACGWATFSIWIFYIWEFLERVRNLTPLLAAAQFSPAAISGLLAALSTGFLLSKTTPQVIMVLSMFAFLIGTTLIATTPVKQIYWAQVFVSVVVMPWGMDMSFPSATILLSSKVGKENQGVAMSLVNTVVNYSISVGLGLAGTVQMKVDHGDATRLLDGFRAAWYFGIGLSGCGVLIAGAFLGVGWWKGRRGGVLSGEKEGSNGV
ncbi:hypothetical protein EPUS_06880 [Endocarpon pusillum Z07020]|uniref:Major facilitator superfamily (MFS) profile domain-containing protein n=1 Tax=Endocarpon pusillum (strain Z07020 / HMAS-L-300199) TaxID=1263415 RepID=U1GH50_ENDPU|nr:uncharacterized protein EPUS_06880 [Endocarpon pusillum Z07020]ERF77012.1 hypothetical protein EPUS_06880 [Endocarpon pusillum Z07020]